MNHTIIPILIIAAFLNHGFAKEQNTLPQPNCPKLCEHIPKPCGKSNVVHPTLEVKGAYFFFSDSKMRKIFNHGGGDVQLSASYPIWKWLQIYGSVEYMQRHGKSLSDHQKTSIWEIPLSLGLKPVIKISPTTHYYITLGPRYFFVHTHANSSFVDKTYNENGCGGFANMGFNFFPYRHLLVDVFAEYSYKRMHFHSHKQNTYGQTVQIGGFAFGAGLGYAF